jgi:hypothetical protein
MLSSTHASPLPHTLLPTTVLTACSGRPALLLPPADDPHHAGAAGHVQERQLHHHRCNRPALLCACSSTLLIWQQDPAGRLQGTSAADAAQDAFPARHVAHEPSTRWSAGGICEACLWLLTK